MEGKHMSEKIKSLIWLFFTGYIQIILIAINTWQIANGKWLGASGVSFAISLVWTLNVKKIAFGGWTERITYSVGGALGCFSGMFITKLVY
jgi:hypothetical protein